LNHGRGRQLKKCELAVLQRLLGRYFARLRRLARFLPRLNLWPKNETEDQENEVGSDGAPKRDLKAEFGALILPLQPLEREDGMLDIHRLGGGRRSHRGFRRRNLRGWFNVEPEHAFIVASIRCMCR